MNSKSILIMLALLAVSAVGIAGASTVNPYGDYDNSSVLYAGETTSVTVTSPDAYFTFTVMYDPELTDVVIDTSGLVGNNSIVTTDGQSGDGVDSLTVLGVDPDTASFVVKITPITSGDRIEMSFGSPAGIDGLSLETVYAGKSGGGTGSATVTTLVNGTAPVPTEPSVPAVTEEPIVTPAETSVPVDDNTSDVGSSDVGSADDGADAGKSVPGLGLIGIIGGLGAAAFMARRRNV